MSDNTIASLPSSAAPRPAEGDLKIDTIGKPARIWDETVVQVVAIMVVFTSWEILGRQVSPLFMSYPTAILQAGWRMIMSGELGDAAWHSLQSLAIGFVVGTVLAIILGLLIGRYRYFAAATEWMVTVVYVTPNIAWVPLVTIWMGYGTATKLFIIIIHAFFPVIINTIAGVRDVSRQLIDVGRAFNATEQQMFRKFILPAAIPYIMTGVRLAVGRAVIGLVVGEFFTAVTGLGALIIKYGSRYQTASMFVPIVVLMLLGITLNAIAERLEKRLTPWAVGRVS